MKKNVHVPSLAARPPVVAVLGHVDHGKTTLLDFIRKTNVVSREHGGITQHIGAYQAMVSPKGKPSSRANVREAKVSRGIPSKSKVILRQDFDGKLSRTAQDDHAQGRLITFIDTPGHEAFAKMRSRGAGVADIAVLVVAADDSVMPQTRESISQIQAANISMIAVINKTDLPAADVERVKRDLGSVGVQLEGFGGDVPYVALSAKTGKGVPELLEMIALVADMRELKSEPDAPVAAVVIETRVDKGRGTVASVIVKRGTLRVGTVLFDGDNVIVKVRGMFDENGQSVREAGPSKPVEVMGFQKLPTVGSVLTAQAVTREKLTPVQSTKNAIREMPDFLKPVEEEKRKLRVVLKADTAGSLEAIEQSLGDGVERVGSGVGDMTEADVFLAKTSGAIVVGFNIKIVPSVQKIAETEKVVLRTYQVIYTLLEEIAEVVHGLREVTTGERELGKGEVVAEFPYEKSRIAGTKVVSGRLSRGDMVRIVREETEVGRAKIRSMRHGKDEINKAPTGTECGILLDHAVDFQLGDAIIAVTTG